MMANSAVHWRERPDVGSTAAAQTSPLGQGSSIGTVTGRPAGASPVAGGLASRIASRASSFKSHRSFAPDPDHADEVLLPTRTSGNLGGISAAFSVAAGATSTAVTEALDGAAAATSSGVGDRGVGVTARGTATATGISLHGAAAHPHPLTPQPSPLPTHHGGLQGRLFSRTPSMEQSGSRRSGGLLWPVQPAAGPVSYPAPTPASGPAAAANGPLWPAAGRAAASPAQPIGGLTNTTIPSGALMDSRLASDVASPVASPVPSVLLHESRSYEVSGATAAAAAAAAAAVGPAASQPVTTNGYVFGGASAASAASSLAARPTSERRIQRLLSKIDSVCSNQSNASGGGWDSGPNSMPLPGVGASSERDGPSLSPRSPPLMAVGEYHSLLSMLPDLPEGAGAGAGAERGGLSAALGGGGQGEGVSWGAASGLVPSPAWGLNVGVEGEGALRRPTRMPRRSNDAGEGPRRAGDGAPESLSVSVSESGGQVGPAEVVAGGYGDRCLEVGGSPGGATAGHAGSADNSGDEEAAVELTLRPLGGGVGGGSGGGAPDLGRRSVAVQHRSAAATGGPLQRSIFSALGAMARDAGPQDGLLSWPSAAGNLGGGSGGMGGGGRPDSGRALFRAGSRDSGSLSDSVEREPSARQLVRLPSTGLAAAGGGVSAGGGRTGASRLVATASGVLPSTALAMTQQAAAAALAAVADGWDAGRARGRAGARRGARAAWGDDSQEWGSSLELSDGGRGGDGSSVDAGSSSDGDDGGSRHTAPLPGVGTRMPGGRGARRGVQDVLGARGSVFDAHDLIRSLRGAFSDSGSSCSGGVNRRLNPHMSPGSALSLGLKDAHILDLQQQQQQQQSPSRQGRRRRRPNPRRPERASLELSLGSFDPAAPSGRPHLLQPQLALSPPRSAPPATRLGGMGRVETGPGVAPAAPSGLYATQVALAAAHRQSPTSPSLQTRLARPTGRTERSAAWVGEHADTPPSTLSALGPALSDSDASREQDERPSSQQRRAAAPDVDARPSLSQPAQDETPLFQWTSPGRGSQGLSRQVSHASSRGSSPSSSGRDRGRLVPASPPGAAGSVAAAAKVTPPPPALLGACASSSSCSAGSSALTSPVAVLATTPSAATSLIAYSANLSACIDAHLSTPVAAATVGALGHGVAGGSRAASSGQLTLPPPRPVGVTSSALENAAAVVALIDQDLGRVSRHSGTGRTQAAAAAITAASSSDSIGGGDNSPLNKTVCPINGGGGGPVPGASTVNTGLHALHLHPPAQPLPYGCGNVVPLSVLPSRQGAPAPPCGLSLSVGGVGAATGTAAASVGGGGGSAAADGLHPVPPTSDPDRGHLAAQLRALGGRSQRRLRPMSSHKESSGRDSFFTTPGGAVSAGGGGTSGTSGASPRLFGPSATFDVPRRLSAQDYRRSGSSSASAQYSHRRHRLTGEPSNSADSSGGGGGGSSSDDDDLAHLRARLGRPLHPHPPVTNGAHSGAKDAYGTPGAAGGTGADAPYWHQQQQPQQHLQHFHGHHHHTAPHHSAVPGGALQGAHLHQSLQQQRVRSLGAAAGFGSIMRRLDEQLNEAAPGLAGPGSNPSAALQQSRGGVAEGGADESEQPLPVPPALSAPSASRLRRTTSKLGQGAVIAAAATVTAPTAVVDPIAGGSTPLASHQSSGRALTVSSVPYTSPLAARAPSGRGLLAVGSTEAPPPAAPAADGAESNAAISTNRTASLASPPPRPSASGVHHAGTGGDGAATGRRSGSGVAGGGGGDPGGVAATAAAGAAVWQPAEQVVGDDGKAVDIDVLKRELERLLAR